MIKFVKNVRFKIVLLPVEAYSVITVANIDERKGHNCRYTEDLQCKFNLSQLNVQKFGNTLYPSLAY